MTYVCASIPGGGMTKVCVKCGYLRQASDIAPEYECPKCGSRLPR